METRLSRPIQGSEALGDLGPKDQRYSITDRLVSCKRFKKRYVAAIVAYSEQNVQALLVVHVECYQL